MSTNHCYSTRLHRTLVHSRNKMSIILALLLVVGAASGTSAQQAKQPQQRDRNLEPSGCPWPGGDKMARSLTFDDGVAGAVAIDLSSIALQLVSGSQFVLNLSAVLDPMITMGLTLFSLTVSVAPHLGSPV